MGRGLLPRSDAGRPQTDHHCPWEARPGHQRVRKQADQAAKQLRAICLEDGEERLLALSHAHSAAMPGERAHAGLSRPSRRTASGRGASVRSASTTDRSRGLAVVHGLPLDRPLWPTSGPTACRPERQVSDELPALQTHLPMGDATAADGRKRSSKIARQSPFFFQLPYRIYDIELCNLS